MGREIWTEAPCWTHGGNDGVTSLPVAGDALRGKVPAVAPPCVCSLDVGGVKITTATLTTPTSRSTRLLPGVVYLMLFILKKQTKKDDVRYVTTVNELAFLSAAEQFLLYTTFLMQ